MKREMLVARRILCARDKHNKQKFVFQKCSRLVHTKHAYKYKCVYIENIAAIYLISSFFVFGQRATEITTTTTPTPTTNAMNSIFCTAANDIIALCIFTSAKI